MDANCPPGRARPRNVVARGEVADTLCVDAGEKCLFLALRFCSLLDGRTTVYVRYGSKADVTEFVDIANCH